MALNAEKLIALQIPPQVQTFTWRDTVLYALGLGFGLDPLDEQQLRFVDETRLAVVPTMANVLAHPGFWMRDLDTGIDWVKVVHGEQRMQIHKALPIAGEVVGHTRVLDVVDKGPDKGALVSTERTISDAQTGELFATLVQVTMCRGDGGFSGNRVPAAGASHALATPASTARRPPDHSVNLPTHAQQALIYRLSGDLNPLHADPAIARRAGYDRPIFHGLGTFGIAGHALLATLCDYEPGRVRGLDARFSSPVFPGETITVDMWAESAQRVRFEAWVKARRTRVMSNGVFTYAPRESGNAASIPTA